MAGFELLQFETAVTAMQEQCYGQEPSFVEHLRRRAGDALADIITRDASLYRRIEPDEDDLSGVVRHRWKIGIQTNKTELEARESQLEEARLQGRREAAEYLRAEAQKYEHVHGHCKFVIMESLRSAARYLDTSSKPS